jgi:peroxiredoxin
MKKLLYSSLILIAACKQNDTTGFTVDGAVKNSNAKTIYLEETSFAAPQPVIVDSAILGKDGSFELTTKAKEESIYNLRLGQNPYPFVSFINDAKKITINADLNSPDALYTVKGSAASEALRNYLFTTSLKMRSIYNSSQLIDSMQHHAIKDSLIEPTINERNAAVKELKNYTVDFINKSNSPALTLFALGSYQSIANNPSLQLEGFTQQELTDIINKTATKFPNDKSIAAIKASMQKQQPVAASGSLLNKPAPDFTRPDVNGKPTSLSSFKGKYVLVDFWASWCPPCRAENPNVVKAYNQFKDKNFTVLGVSLDRPGQKDAWMRAVKDDNLTWTQVSDLKFWDSQVVNLYGFEGIPYNVLVNPDGVVIGESLRGDELEKKLSEVLR